VLFWAEAAPAVSVSPGGFGAEVSGLLSATLQPVAALSISGFGFVPLWRQDVVAQEGSASVSSWLVGVASDAHVEAGALELAAGIGIASAIVVMQGDAAGALEGREETELVAAPLVRASAHLDLGGPRVVLRAHAGASIPRIEMRFDQREIAHWGQPFVAISLGLKLPLIDR
jgi:hypothetical protein